MTFRHMHADRRSATRRPSPQAEAPGLNLKLGSKLRGMLVLNAIPIAIVIWLGISLSQGTVGFREGVAQRPLLIAVAGILGCLAVVMIALWILLPIGRWLYRYPNWQRRHGSALWIVPELIGGLCSLVLGVAAVTVVVLALAMAATGVWHVFLSLDQGATPAGG